MSAGFFGGGGLERARRITVGRSSTSRSSETSSPTSSGLRFTCGCQQFRSGRCQMSAVERRFAATPLPRQTALVDEAKRRFAGQSECFVECERRALAAQPCQIAGLDVGGEQRQQAIS